MKKAACVLGVSRMAEEHVTQDDPGWLFSLHGLGCGVGLFSIALFSIACAGKSTC